MTFTRGVVNGKARDGEILGRAQRRLLRAYRRLGTWRAVAQERGVNHGYVVAVMHGSIPHNEQVRQALGLPRVMPSERKARVRKIIPLLGSDGWEEIFFKRVRPRKWRIAK